MKTLRTSLEHLIANAMIFRDPAELIPMVSVHVHHPDDDVCTIAVRDNGVGLSLVHQNLQACGATISYAPVIGGSCFEIRFPVQPGVSVAV